MSENNGAATVQAGDTAEFLVSVLDGDGNPLDISAASEITYELSRDDCSTPIISYTLANPEIVILPIDPVSNPDQNQYTITLSPTVTATLCGVYTHKSVLTNSGGEVQTVFNSSDLYIEG